MDAALGDKEGDAKGVARVRGPQVARTPCIIFAFRTLFTSPQAVLEYLISCSLDRTNQFFSTCEVIIYLFISTIMKYTWQKRNDQDKKGKGMRLRSCRRVRRAPGQRQRRLTVN